MSHTIQALIKNKQDILANFYKMLDIAILNSKSHIMQTQKIQMASLIKEYSKEKLAKQPKGPWIFCYGKIENLTFTL